MIGMQLSGGQFEITSKLGEGGFATVFRGTQKTPQRGVAIKVLHASLANQAGVVTRFHHEAQTLARFDHPHIMKIYFEGEDQGMHYFVAQLLQEDLRGRLDGPSPPDARESLRILRQISDALDYMHRKGFIHRDFKPANILFDENQNAVLTDFGLARGHDLTMVTQQGMILGTAAYMAPEQLQPGPAGVDARADLYALGCVMFELLEGRPPFPSGDFFAICHSHLYEPAPPLSVPGLPANLVALVASLLAKKPEERPETAEVVLEEIVAAEYELSAIHGPAKRSTARSGAVSGDRPAGAQTPSAPPMSASSAPPASAQPQEAPRAASPPAATVTPPSGADQWSMMGPAPQVAPPSPPAPAPRPQPAAPAPTPSAAPSTPVPPPAPPRGDDETTVIPRLASTAAGSSPPQPRASEPRAPRGTPAPERPAPPPPPLPAAPRPARRIRVPMIVGLVVLGLGIAIASEWMGRHARNSGAGGAAGAVAAAQGTVVLRVDPPNALANLDGKPLPGLEPFSIPLDAGATHSLEVTLTGYTSEKREIRARGGAVDTLHVALRPAESGTANQTPIPPGVLKNLAGKAPETSSSAGVEGAPPQAAAPPQAHQAHQPTPAPPRTSDDSAKAPVGRGDLNVACVSSAGIPLPASVALDGQLTGEQTPCVLDNLSADVHRVRIGKAGYHMESATLDEIPAAVDGDEVIVRLKPGRALHLRVVLTKD